MAASDDICWVWAASWFGDADVCQIRDKIGFLLGLLSVACWVSVGTRSEIQQPQCHCMQQTAAIARSKWLPSLATCCWCFCWGAGMLPTLACSFLAAALPAPRYTLPSPTQGLAEVPQLFVNYMEGSSEGISEGLLWLWVFSDVLDVAGCSLSDTVR